MAVRLLVAVTDRDWFEYLRTKPALSEVNFWAPGAASFRALEAGELFLFKLHAPLNFIVGGGVFTYANTFPCSLAWEAFMREMGRPRSPICDKGSLNIVASMLRYEKTFRSGAVSLLNRSFLTSTSGFRCPQAGRLIS